MNNIENIGNFIITLAPEIISKLKNGYWRIEKSESLNGRQDISTLLDHEIGQYIGTKIRSQFDDVTIDTEEREERIEGRKITVRIDPLDGSKNAVSGIDLIATAISINYSSITYFGLVINPFSEKVYWAFKGKGAYLNKKRIVVNQESIVTNFVIHEQPTSKLYSINNKLFNRYTKFVDVLMKKAYRLRNIGLSTLSVGWVAEGAACAYIDFSGTTKLYDIEAPIMIAEEAGAMIGTFAGKKIMNISYSQGSDKKYLIGNLIVANPRAYEEIVKLFRRIEKE